MSVPDVFVYLSAEVSCVTAYQGAEKRDYPDFPSGIFGRIAKNTSKSPSPSDLQGQRRLPRVLTPGLLDLFDVFTGGPP